MKTIRQLGRAARLALLAALTLTGTGAQAQSSPSFDIAYLSEFVLHCSNGFGIGSLGLIINTGSQTIDPSSLSVVSVVADDPTVVPQVLIQQAPAPSLGPGQADGILSIAAQQLITNSGLVPEPVVNHQFYLDFGLSNIPAVEGKVIHSTATLALGDQTITLPFTVHWTAAFPCTDFGILTVSRVHSSGGQAAAALSSLTLTPSNSVTGTISVAGTVSLDGPAPADGAVVTLSSSDPALPTPNPVAIPAGATSQSFTLFNHCVTSPTPVVVTASYAGATRSQTVTLQPSSFLVSAVTLDKSAVVSGTSVNATVSLGSPAPPGASISVTPPLCLFGCSPAVSVPSSIAVPPGATSVVFQIKTLSVTSSTSVPITVGPGCPPVTVNLVVNPNTTSGSNNQTPAATGSTPPSGGSPPGVSKQFQLLFQGWSTVVIPNIPNGYMRVMQWQITNSGTASASNISVGTDNGFTQSEKAFSLDPGKTAVVHLNGPVQTTADCNSAFQGYPVNLSVNYGSLTSPSTQSDHQVISGPPKSPGCP